VVRPRVLVIHSAIITRAVTIISISKRQHIIIIIIVTVAKRSYSVYIKYCSNNNSYCVTVATKINNKIIIVTVTKKNYSVYIKYYSKQGEKIVVLVRIINNNNNNVEIRIQG
jgi:hypothetical protein